LKILLQIWFGNGNFGILKFSNHNMGMGFSDLWEYHKIFYKDVLPKTSI